MKKNILVCFLASFLSACMPPETGQKNHRAEDPIAVREMRIDVNDLRHKIENIFVEIQILEGKIDAQSSAVSRLQSEWKAFHNQDVDERYAQVNQLNSKVNQLAERQGKVMGDIRSVGDHAKDTSKSLRDYSKRLADLEAMVSNNDKNVEEKLQHLKTKIHSLLSILDTHSRSLATVYKVKEGDSLERIARKHGTSTEALKKANKLESDLIVIGQELRLP